MIKKEMIKAIRMVKGFNPDLRVRLDGINKESLYYWVKENAGGILGAEYSIVPDVTTKEYDEWNKAIENVVNSVVSGKEI